MGTDKVKACDTRKVPESQSNLEALMWIVRLEFSGAFQLVRDAGTLAKFWVLDV